MRLLTWACGEGHVLSTRQGQLVLKPLFWTTASRAALPLFMALLDGVPTLRLC